MGKRVNGYVGKRECRNKVWLRLATARGPRLAEPSWVLGYEGLNPVSHLGRNRAGTPLAGEETHMCSYDRGYVGKYPQRRFPLVQLLFIPDLRLRTVHVGYVGKMESTHVAGRAVESKCFRGGDARASTRQVDCVRKSKG